MFDTSAYPEDHPEVRNTCDEQEGSGTDERRGWRKDNNRVRRSEIKIDEYDGMCEKEFCDGGCKKGECLGSGGKKCKGVKSGVVKNVIDLEHYKDCLFYD